MFTTTITAEAMAQQAQLNTAIMRVISRERKMDAKEEHAAVKAAGYTVERMRSGGYSVSNKATGRTVYITRTDYMGTRLYHGQADVATSCVKNLAKFDFVNCLNKPVNTEWRAVLWAQHRGELSVAKQRHEKLQRARWSVNYEKDRIARIQKQINELSADLVRAGAAQARAERELQDLKKALGL